MLSYLVCRKCWKKFITFPPVQEVGEVNNDGSGTTYWECSLPVHKVITEDSDIPAGCFYKFEQAVYSGTVNIDKDASGGVE